MDRKHYFIEQDSTGRFVAKPRGEAPPDQTFATQEEAIAFAKHMNPTDHPDVERVRNTATGGRDQWRSAR